MLAALLSGLAFGAVNLAHCAGMCGPLAAAGCARTGRAGLLRYQVGRGVAYAYAGAIAGQLGRGLSLAEASWVRWLFPLLSAAACVVAARTLFVRTPRVAWVQLGLGPRPKRAWFARLAALLPRDPLPLGLLSVLLPCGLLAAALLAAVATGTPSSGAAFMLGFAAASGGALLGAGLLAQLAPRFSIHVRRGLACVLLVTGLLSVAKPLAAIGGNEPETHHCH